MITIFITFLIGELFGALTISLHYIRKRVGYLKVSRIEGESNPYVFLDLDKNIFENYSDGDIILLKIKDGPNV